jgi:uncharacterized membrane protein YqjE
MPASSPPPVFTGFIDSLRTFGGNLVATVRDRVELFSVELQEEKFRAVQMLIWAGLGVFSAVMTTTCLTAMLIYLFWETARLTVLTAFALFYGGVSLVIFLKLRRLWARQPRPLEATLQELAADQECLRPKS